VSSRWLNLLLVALAACNGGNGPAPDASAGPEPDAGAPAGDPQLPPQGQAALEAWLKAGFYKDWTCEDGIRDKRLNGAHGRHRICSNRGLIESLDGLYPVGAASVKEMYEADDRPNGFAVGIKVAAGADGNSWYWYERTGTSPTSRPVADGVGAKLCGPDCHVKAPRDHVFIRARE
jgi:hypothetical protein